MITRLMYILPLLLLMGCSKPAPVETTPVAPVTVSPASQGQPMVDPTKSDNAPVAVAPAPMTQEQTVKEVAKDMAKLQTIVVKAAPKPAKVTKPVKAKKVGYTEMDGNADALVAVVRANCLLDAVDKKLNWDVDTNTIHDLGNVRTAPVCSAYDPTQNKDVHKQAVAYLKAQDKVAKKAKAKR